ncbi:MAG TPA: hypothetical protein VFO80_05685 [Sphingomonas sp.]|nr:hypothetical protein [Sphingomonas sp.]
MARRPTSANSGDEATNAPPSDIGLDDAAQFRTLSARIDELTKQVSKIEKPNGFRLADFIQLGIIIVGLLIAIFSAFGLKDRIDDLVKAQSSVETRISAQISASETRTGARIDRIEDRLTKIGERTATIEGGRSR